MESVLGGRRLGYAEVAQNNFTCGFRRENLATAIAICDWESARYEEARLIYDNGASDDGVMQINEKVWRGERSIEDWHKIVWDAEENFKIARDIFEGRKSRLGTSKDGFSAWVAFTNGNYKRTMQAARHYAAQVDSSFFPVKSFKWWGIRWIPGDGKIFEETWYAMFGKTELAKARLERWKTRYPKQTVMLWQPTNNVQHDKRELDDVSPNSLDLKIAAKNQGENYNINPSETRKALRGNV